jgi:hypothetical protein
MEEVGGGYAMNIAIVLGTILLAVVLIYGTTHYRKRGRGPTAPRSYDQAAPTQIDENSARQTKE